MQANEPTATETFQRLMRTLQQRVAEQPAGSYTTKLVLGGTAKIGEKIIEEAAEMVEAAGEPGPAGREHLIRETADLLFHAFVMLAHRQVELEEVAEELARREGVSGLEEKRQRTLTKNGEESS